LLWYVHQTINASEYLTIQIVDFTLVRIKWPVYSSINKPEFAHTITKSILNESFPPKTIVLFVYLLNKIIVLDFNLITEIDLRRFLLEMYKFLFVRT